VKFLDDLGPLDEPFLFFLLGESVKYERNQTRVLLLDRLVHEAPTVPVFALTVGLLVEEVVDCLQVLFVHSAQLSRQCQTRVSPQIIFVKVGCIKHLIYKEFGNLVELLPKKHFV